MADTRTTDWEFRPSTLDRAIYNGVVLFNEYRLPPAFGPKDIVIDVGCHIGSFAHAAVTRGCRHVHAFEPDRENFQIAWTNLQRPIEEELVELVHGTVWQSDENDHEFRFIR